MPITFKMGGGRDRLSFCSFVEEEKARIDRREEQVYFSKISLF